MHRDPYDSLARALAMAETPEERAAVGATAADFYARRGVGARDHGRDGHSLGVLPAGPDTAARWDDAPPDATPADLGAAWRS